MEKNEPFYFNGCLITTEVGKDGTAMHWQQRCLYPTGEVDKGVVRLRLTDREFANAREQATPKPYMPHVDPKPYRPSVAA